MEEITKQSIVFYDGTCGLCHNAVRFILRFEKSSVLLFTSLESEFAQMMRKKGILTTKDNSVVLIENGKEYTKSCAAMQISKYLKFPFNGFVIFKIVPTILLNSIYDWVANNRFRFFKQSCWLPNKRYLSRFI